MRAGVALLAANGRFWSHVAPLAKVQLKRWELRASLIEDRDLRLLALDKLREESFNSEVAATLATIAPRPYRAVVIEAIVAYEVMYDYLDGLTELPTQQPIRDGRQLYRAFTDAVTLEHFGETDYYALHEGSDDGGYLAELATVVHNALSQLPSISAVSHVCDRAATRCAEAQIRAHAVTRMGAGQLEDWASREAAEIPLGWQEFLAGAASSVLAVHALIAAAADPRTTPAQAGEIDTVYLSICMLSTMLDSLVDHQLDLETSQAGFLRYYDSHEAIANDLQKAARRAVAHTASLRHGAHHTMTLVGVAAYYLSAPAANEAFAKPIAQRVHRELRPLITPTLAIMRGWRLAKRTWPSAIA